MFSTAEIPNPENPGKMLITTLGQGLPLSRIRMREVSINKGTAARLIIQLDRLRTELNIPPGMENVAAIESLELDKSPSYKVSMAVYRQMGLGSW
jgi:hypothetical protein